MAHGRDPKIRRPEDSAARVWCFGAGTGGQLGCGGVADALTAQALLLPHHTSGHAEGVAEGSITLHLAAGGNHVVAWWRKPALQPQAGEQSSAGTPGPPLHGSCEDTGGTAGRTGSDSGVQDAQGSGDPESSRHAAPVLTWGHDVSGAAPAHACDTTAPAPAAASGLIATATPGPSSLEDEAGGASANGVAGCGLLLTPRAVALPRGGCGGVALVACGWEHTVYLTEDGSVWVAGRGSRGQLGLGPGPGGAVAAQPRSLTGALAAALPGGWAVTSVAAGMWHTLFAAAPAAGHRSQTSLDSVAAGEAADGTAEAAVAAAAAPAGAASGPRAWQQCGGAAAVILGCGSNRRRQLGQCGQPDRQQLSREAGNGGTSARGATVPEPPPAETVRPGQGRGASRGSTCAAPPAAAWTPVLVHMVPGGASGGVTAATATAVQVAAGGDRSGYLDGAGCLFLWGRGLPPAGQDTGQPTEVPLPHTRASDSGSAAAAAAVAGANGQRVEPEAAAWRQVALGWQHVLALDTCGRVWAWGGNRNGQLGRPPPPSSPAPPPPQPQPSTAGAAVGSEAGPIPPQLQAATGTGNDAPRCVGAEEDGRGVVVAASAVPLRVPLPAAAACVAAGAEHCAAVLLDGRVLTWGWGEHGMLGVGDTHSRWQPQAVLFSGAAGQCRIVACGAGFTLCA